MTGRVMRQQAPWLWTDPRQGSAADVPDPIVKLSRKAAYS